MKLQKLNLVFGDRQHPTSLSEDEMTTLLRAIEDDTLTDKHFAGHITSPDGVKGSVAWMLGTHGLTYVGKMLADTYTLSADRNVVTEGQTITITADGLSVAALRLEVDTITVKSGGVTPDYVRALCTFNGNVLTIAKGDNINGWQAEITVKATPRFDSPSTATLKVTANGRILPTSMEIVGDATIKLGEETTVDYTFNLTPSTSNVPLENLDVQCDSQYVTVQNVTPMGFQLVVPAVNMSFKVTATAMVEGRSLATEKTIATQVILMHAGHEYVDLNLPSGRLWATTNIGAETSDKDGLYFQWGGTTGHKQGEGYNFSSGNYPQSGISRDLDVNQDAARANWGGEWRMPSKEDFAELAANCYMERVTNYNGTGVAGLIFFSCKDNATGKGLYNSAGTWYAWGGSYYNSATSQPAGFVPYSLDTPHVFFPASGYCSGTSLYTRGSYGYYWSRSFYSSSYAYYLYFFSSDVRPQYYSSRYYGFTVRPCL